MTTWRVGDIEITSIFEVDAGAVIDGILPDATDAARLRVPWLRPRFVDDRGRSRAIVQLLGVRAGSVRILVDAGVGDGKLRPEIRDWSLMRSGTLERLEEAGFGPDHLDLVVVTHLHLDHVGWLTRGATDGAWTPTFPRARHLLVDRELDSWLGFPVGPSADALAAIEDSVRPVVAAGIVDRVQPGERVVPGVSLVPSHGHTPGHTSVLIESRGESMLITGDAIHHPIQLAHPDWGSASDTDAAQAASVRLDLLERCATDGTLLFGSHFAGAKPYGVIREGHRSFALSD
jgi:glyoxylase-like metal-dependent hydrolase (beta-lactamase superfamily II)